MKLLVLALFASTLPLAAQSSVSFHFERIGVTTSSWTIDVKSDGSGLYKASANGAEPIKISPGTMARLMGGEPAVAANNCVAKERNIANTGRKDITYTMPSGPEHCIFNYSDDEKLNDAASAFLAIQETLQIGEHFNHLRRYDRLGLDPEMETLENEIKSGRAIEIQNIAPSLQAIADDERLIDRVRRRATELLKEVK